ncbi:GPI mannosyltransferase 1 [Pyricularia oryzae]|uniref:GPI mannosyltransferase 1 n=5 Tax=Pyricularia TaxID=48558 RepID=A0ABQ8NBU9_PYRGI|nr:GPI mannosyltransferase 1 [Pyricularia oryzae 70-15]ELQ41342.1 GPI mannosyltransferase 1 [Pyricularia oryzae Y34]KAH8841999.1 GPI mannosyltransferase 1 [Pyricularia oryzae]KAI6294588.1 GPI mannosyltransferase 1 [Pyricularia grisea]EHA57257.1 GPI mannosyltransferase 1 [Pyricularia oryzae 70-15]KAI6283554.1 GPI mannosyltransferase 1 [Pyricularia oryzae]
MSSPKPPGTSRSGPARTIDAFFNSPSAVYTAATLLRLGMLLYGLWQDAVSPVKYTDIDYLVFTDAARFVADGGSPYDRETYRYTPLLAWMLVPTTTWFEFGKVLFAAADLAAGHLLVSVLVRRGGMDGGTARRYAAVWLLNPMVAAISTRGSSEGLLGVLVAALLWAVLERRVVLAGVVLGLGVHFKIYPFIYAPAIVWWMDRERMQRPGAASPSFSSPASAAELITRFVTRERITLAGVSLATFMGLNYAMYALYGTEFIVHTYLHHVSRIDHRHNFSPYNTLLYLNSASPPSASSPFRIESVAFLPQLLLSTVLIPLVLAKRHLPTSMLAQTFAFVTFNKVCTSQYFLWYMVLLPLYLPHSSFLRSGRLGLAALLLWVAGQAAWLQQGYLLEFLGQSTFLPGLWVASLGFFLVNCWILGVIVSDVVNVPVQRASVKN